MGMISRFDISSDFTQFFLAAFIVFMIIAVLMTIVSPKRKGQKGLRKVDDRYVDPRGDLID